MNVVRFPVQIPYLIMLKSQPTLISHQKTVFNIVMTHINAYPLKLMQGPHHWCLQALIVSL
jgi:hypothetical protein